jgi:hypothetical protein
MPILIPQIQNTDLQQTRFTLIYETVRFRTVGDAKPDDFKGKGMQNRPFET